MKIVKKIYKCRICNSDKVPVVLKLGKSPIGENFKKKKTSVNSYDLNLQQCKNCGLCQIQDVINPRILYKNYLYQSNSSLYLDKHFTRYVKSVSKFLKLKENSLVIDIGSNDGLLLSKFKNNNYDVIGIEPAIKISKIANKNKIKTFNYFFDNKSTSKILNLKKKVSLITANNVLANIDNVNLWFRNVKKIIQDHGFFVFESFYLNDVIKNKVLDFIYHEHLSIFSIRSVKFLCEKHDLKLINLEKVYTKGGSLRFFICSKKNKFKINNIVNKLERNEYKNNCFKASTYKKLENFLNKNKQKINYLLSKLKKNQIIGLGASISCITLIYQLGIHDKIKYLLDDNTIKHGMFSPGSNIEIQNPKKFKFNNNQTILVLAWRFKRILIKKYKSKFKGRVLNIWPKIKYEKNCKYKKNNFVNKRDCVIE
jgi:hypothetical protein